MGVIDDAAAKPNDSDPYPHPFLTPEGQAVLDQLRMTLGTSDPEVLIGHIVVEGMIVSDEAGWRTSEWIRPNDATLAAINQPRTERSPASSDVPLASVGEPLDLALLAASPSDELAVEICTRRGQWKPVVSVGHEVDLAILRGDISTWGDERRLRAETQRSIMRAGREAVRDLLFDFDGRGIVLNRISKLSGCARLSAPAAVVEEMTADPIVATADLVNDETIDHAGYWWNVDGTGLTGYELEDLIQSTQFYEEGYKIDLAIQWDDNGTWTDVATSETDDNRQRVYIEPNNVAYRAEFYGRDVSGIPLEEEQGCGENSIKVWFSAFMEDSDRDDNGDTAVPDPPYVRSE